jgi:small subunit ribosomal protein S3
MTNRYFAITMILILVISFTLTIGCQKAKEKAAEVKDKAVETAGSVTEKVEEEAEVIKEIAAEAKDKVIEVVDDVKKSASINPGALTEKAVDAKDESVEISGDVTDKAAEVVENK